MSTLTITDDIKAMQDAPAEVVLGWALKKFHPRVALATSLQDAILIDMALRVCPDVRVFTIDTGRLPEGTYALAADIIERYDINIEWYFPRHEAVEKIMTDKGAYGFRQSLENRHECCQIRKVEPLSRALKGVDAWITGMRREESQTRRHLAKIEVDEANGGILKINPLADWSLVDIRNYLEQHDIPYNSLLDSGYQSIGCACCTRPVAAGEDQRAGRWWWEQPEHKECGLHSRNLNFKGAGI